MKMNPTFFDKLDNNNISSFLEKSGPKILKKSEKERKRIFYEGKGPYTRGGNKTNKINKNKKMKKSL
jgi:hypothetical protein